MNSSIFEDSANSFLSNRGTNLSGLSSVTKTLKTYNRMTGQWYTHQAGNYCQESYRDKKKGHSFYNCGIHETELVLCRVFGLGENTFTFVRMQEGDVQTFFLNMMYRRGVVP